VDAPSLAPKVRSERLLLGLLQADLELAFTFLQTAAIEAGTDAVHGESALSKARTVLEAIRRFQGRVKDPKVWVIFRDRANELQACIEAFEKIKLNPLPGW
jgi:hypothetical protein